MITQTITTYDELCPGCDQGDRISWVNSTPATDTWACRRCGMQWVVTVADGTQADVTTPRLSVVAPAAGLARLPRDTLPGAVVRPRLAGWTWTPPGTNRCGMNRKPLSSTSLPADCLSLVS